MEGRKALCVGINSFKNYPDAALQGCVNDARQMSKLLKDFLGFKTADISTLTNSKATKKNIMNALKEMVLGAQKGKYSYLVFSMSSHGTQIADTSGDETDAADEAFCPHDLAQKGSDWDPRYIISDDELRDLFLQLPANVLLEVYLDTCHSGTGLKAIDLLLTRQPRYLPPPSLLAFKRIQNVKARTLPTTLAAAGLKQHILWAACKDDQTSADAYIDGDWHGAFTYYFDKALRAAKGNANRKELLKKVREFLQSNDYNQIPQLEYQATGKGNLG
jgi:metacaspase-1